MDAPATQPIPDPTAAEQAATTSPAPVPDPSPAGAPVTAPASVPASPFSLRTLRVLTRGPFGRYVAGDSISMVGMWMQGMAQGLVMMGLTNSVFRLGLVNFAGSIPPVLLMVYGGTLADRLDKRRIIILAQIIQMILASIIGYLVWTHQVQIWHLVTAAFLLGISGAFEMPAASALVPELVDREDFGIAIAADRSIFHAARLVGPYLAAKLVDAFSLSAAFFANALSFLPSIVAIASIQPRAQGTQEEEEQRTSGIMAGLRYVRGDRPTMAMLALITSNALCIFPFMAVTMPIYVKQLLASHPGALSESGGLSRLMMVGATGSLLSTAGIILIPRGRRVGWLTIAAVVICAGLSGLGLAQTFLQAAGALMLLSVGTSLTFALTNTTIQERAPGPMRGRVSSLSALSFLGVSPFASLAMGALADHIGIRTGMFVGAAGYALCALYVFTGPARRMHDAPPEVSPVPVEA